jgi:hypothetical protein
MVSWTVGGHFSLALQLKPVGAERPDWHAMELLIMPLSLFYGAGDIFRATNLNALLKNARWMPVGADQILKKTDATLDHGCNFPRGFYGCNFPVSVVFLRLGDFSREKVDLAQKRQNFRATILEVDDMGFLEWCANVRRIWEISLCSRTNFWFPD